jgi:endonuclease YncB( thermonuclease family)
VVVAILVLWSLVAAIDGDTLAVREGPDVLHIRLAEIDAPEKNDRRREKRARQY